MPNLQGDPQSVLPAIFPSAASSSSANGLLLTQSAKDYLAANPRVSATATITVGGTITNLDVATITITNGTLPAGFVAVTATAVTGDTLESFAQKIAQAINDSPTLDNAEVFVDSGGVAGAVVTVSHRGPVGNSSVITKAVSGAATETLTLGNAGVLAGGSGPVIPLQNFDYAMGGTITNFSLGYPKLVDSVMLPRLVADAQPIM